MKVTFGYRVPQYDASWDELLRAAVLAEELGFDSLWLNDHFVDPVSGRGTSFECWTAAASLAAQTTRVRIGFMTLCNEYRLPQIAAKMATSLDVISGGRLDVGMGAGWLEDDFRQMGIPFPEGKVRLDRLEESLQILRGMFEHERFGFAGEHYAVDDALNNPRPVQRPRPPIWVGGRSNRIARIAARYADWHNLARTTLDAFRTKMALLDTTCERVGRDPATLGRSRNPTLLLRETEAAFEQYVAERAAARGVAPEEHVALLESEGAIFGGPERAISIIQAYVEAGCSCFQLIPRERDQELALRRFAELVLPAFG